MNSSTPSAALIECVPNISEGRRPEVIQAIAAVVETVEGVRLLDVDPGKATNRTVITFAGAPEPVIEAAFRLIQKAAELIDMSTHQGEHPRMGATDVCPLVPVSGITLEECAVWAHKLGERVGRELGIPGYYYESAAKHPSRRNLADCRSGEYEGLAAKFAKPEGQPDFGSTTDARWKQTGATAIGARDFLIAFNVNLNTTSTRRANAVAFDIREKGRMLREGDTLTGKPLLDAQGEPVFEPGKLKAVKGIGWFIEEFGCAQVSYNLTDPQQTPLHVLFDETVRSAQERGMRVTGSELVGLVPLNAMLEAGRHYCHLQQRSSGLPEAELIRIAALSMGLGELKPFVPEERIVEYKLGLRQPGRLVSMNLIGFADETASESPAPGGGSIAAYAGALGASLGAMVANLSAHKRGWDDRWAEFSEVAEQLMKLQARLLQAVDEDTAAFNAIMEAFGLSKNSPEEAALRKEAIRAATRRAIEVPMEVVALCAEAAPWVERMAMEGNPNSVTDAAVGMLCLRTAARGAALNAQVNAKGFDDTPWVAEVQTRIDAVLDALHQAENRVMARCAHIIKS